MEGVLVGLAVPHLAWLGQALLPVFPEISQWDPSSPTPTQDLGTRTWSLAEVSTRSVLSPWVPRPGLTATSWDEGSREDRREVMVCPSCVPSPGMRTPRVSHP